MLDELIEQEKAFAPFLLEKDYTFIGPTPIDSPTFEFFTNEVNNLAPIVAFRRTIHHALSHKESINKALANLPQGTQLAIYVVIQKYENPLVHCTIEKYCEDNKITLP